MPISPSQLEIGPIQLRVLDGVGGNVTKTLYLPAPSKGGLELEWIRKGNTVELIDGSERTRVLGYQPVLTVSWNGGYDSRSGQGYVIGTSNGQRPTWDSLLWILSAAPGTLQVYTSTYAGLTVESVEVKPFGKAGVFYESAGLTFRGREICSEMKLPLS